MSDVQKPNERPITLADMNGRIAELERQRDQALTRCSMLAGEKAEAVDLLKTHVAEVARLDAVINATASPGEQPAAPVTPLQ